MGITINSNATATRTSIALNNRHQEVNRMLSKLSSGQRIVSSSDDAGGHAQSEKLGASVKRSVETRRNLNNAMSFLQGQQKVIETTVNILNRISDLKVMHEDATKNSSDKANYDTEFLNLSNQLVALQSEQYNGVSLFSAFSTTQPGYNGATQLTLESSEDGLQSVSVSRAVLNAEDMKQLVEAGTALDSGFGGLSYVNIGASEPVAQVDTVTISGNIGAGDVFSLTLQDSNTVGQTTSTTTVSYTATAADEGAADPQQNIRDALIAAVNGDATLSPIVTAASGSTNTFTITAADAGDPFTITNASSSGTQSSFTAQTDQANVVAVAQVDTLTLNVGTVEAGDTFSYVVNGNTVTTAALGAGASANDVRDAIISAINADATVNTAVTAASNGNGILTLTSDTAGTTFSTGNLTTNVGLGTTTANVSAVAQVDTLTTTAGVITGGDTYSVDINGTTVTTAALAGGASSDDVRDALVTAINGSGVAGAVTAAATGNAGEFTITSDTAGTSFTRANETVTSGGGGTFSGSNTTANVSAVAQVDTATVPTASVEAGDTFSIVINGNTVTTAGLAGGASADTIRDALITAINADGSVNGAVTAASSGTGEFTITSDTAGTTFTSTNFTSSAGTSTTTANVVAVKQIESLTIAQDTTGHIAVGDSFSVTVNGTTVSHTTTAAGETADSIRTNLITLLNADATISGAITASAGTNTGEFILTSDTAGTAFTLSSSIGGTVDSMSSATTTANVTPFSVTKSFQQLAKMLTINASQQQKIGFAMEQVSQNHGSLERARGRILDVDVADGSTQMARSSIRMQATQAMLLQANTLPSIALQLLG